MKTLDKKVDANFTTLDKKMEDNVKTLDGKIGQVKGNTDHMYEMVARNEIVKKYGPRYSENFEIYDLNGLRLTINNVNLKLDGIAKLIEVQKYLKYFEWKNDFDNNYHSIKISYSKIFLESEKKKAEILNHFKIFFDYDYITIDEASIIIKNSGGKLEQILLKSVDHFDDSPLNFIRNIYKNCPSIEFLLLLFPPFTEQS
ncbi:hypothetical protein GLOIN_2v1489223 [Rhizophagus clarus]|uniref:Uncharacterized protein n=1 Tax=Rhizophagus clarus TaxID=94130 RepID=A0A8H3KVI8_9GLOM|nr:hypothetical protein GLOIN_2v1489223 [Rhizophagus clarus]